MTLVAVCAASLGLLIQACGGSAVAQTSTASDPVEGTWASTITIKDCASGAALGAFKGTTLFNRGGTSAADNSMPISTRGAAFGVWRIATDGSYGANMWFYRFNADGSLAGSQKVKRTFTLTDSGNTLTGSLAIQVIDNTGSVIQQGCGS